jgi:hypothetical protein
VGTQIVTALGVGVDLIPRELLSATLEGWALPTLAEQATEQSTIAGSYTSVPNGSHIVPAEWQLSARTSPLRGGDLSVQLGGGGAIPFGGDDVITRPLFRVTLGVRWAPQSKPVARAPAAHAEGSP